MTKAGPLELDKQVGPIEQELQAVTGVYRYAYSDERYYFRRIVEAIDDMSDSQWDTLSEGAQAWHNEAVDAFEQEDACPPPDPDFYKKSLANKSAGWRGMELMVEYDLKIKAPKVIDLLEEEGYKPKISTLRLQLSIFRSAVKVLASYGVLRKDWVHKIKPEFRTYVDTAQYGKVPAPSNKSSRGRKKGVPNVKNRRRD